MSLRRRGRGKPPGMSIAEEKRPPERGREDEDRSERERAKEPHHDLSNPARDPDETEWPDPYERRSDPRGPEEEGSPRAPSTSEPPPTRNPQDHPEEHS